MNLLGLMFPLVFSIGAVAITNAGTWSDNFGRSSLGPEWRGATNAFSIRAGALRGQSASPLPPAPFDFIETGTNWTDYTIRCQINVVEPNRRVCSKGALILRHTGNEGYVFALHAARKTIEVYRLSNKEMLLTKNAELAFARWYSVRADLRGPEMSFFVDGVLIGTVMDSRTTTGAVGIAVQDVEQTLFDDFSVTGAQVPSNGLEIVRTLQEVALTWPVSFTNHVLETSVDLSNLPWTAVTNSALSDGSYYKLTLPLSSGNRFFRTIPRAGF